MNRRKFILGSIIGGLALGSGGLWISVEGNEEPLDIDFSLTKLNKLMEQNPVTIGEWNLYQVFTHCAQSVEYSMLGYPQHKSDLFKHTAGKAAFSLFLAKGKMTHPLDEAIPGAPGLVREGDVMDAFDRFKTSLIDFKNYDGTLAPHFAYGQLSKHEYEAAHVMHFNNHLQEIVLKNGIEGLSLANPINPLTKHT